MFDFNEPISPREKMTLMKNSLCQLIAAFVCVGGVPARHACSAYCRIRLYVVRVNVVRLTVVQTNAVRHTVGTSNYPCARGTLSLKQIILVLVALSPLYKLSLC